MAQNRAEDESRREASTYDRLMSVVKKGPDVAQAAKVGDPPLVDPTPVAANQAATEVMRQAMGLPAGERGVSAEIVKGGGAAANDPAPRSDAAVAQANGDPFARPNPANAADPNELKPAPDASELKPSGPPDPNELTPAGDSQSASNQPLPPPVQINEIQQGQASSGGGASATAGSPSSSSLASDKDVSSSKKKKKKGLKKILTF